MDYDVLCEANAFDEAGAPLMLRLVHVNDVFDSQPFKVVAPNEDFIWMSQYEPDLCDDEAIEAIFTQAIERQGGTFKELI